MYMFQSKLHTRDGYIIRTQKCFRQHLTTDKMENLHTKSLN
jgi:hypothetical protein